MEWNFNNKHNLDNDLLSVVLMLHVSAYKKLPSGASKAMWKKKPCSQQTVKYNCDPIFTCQQFR